MFDAFEYLKTKGDLDSMSWHLFDEIERHDLKSKRRHEALNGSLGHLLGTTTNCASGGLSQIFSFHE